MYEIKVDLHTAHTQDVFVTLPSRVAKALLLFLGTTSPYERKEAVLNAGEEFGIKVPSTVVKAAGEGLSELYQELERTFGNAG